MVTEAGINKHRDIVLKYRAKYPYLSFPKLAQIVINEEKLNVKANHLRNLIPHIIYEEPKQEVFADENDIVIPESWYQERPHYVIPNGGSRLGEVAEHKTSIELQMFKLKIECQTKK